MESPQRVSVSAQCPQGLTDDQREELVLRLPGFSTLSDSEDLQVLVVEFDVDEPSAEDAVRVGERVFSEVASEVFGAPLVEVEVALASSDA